ncbi:MAG: hypothetical protein JWM68_4210 [Verrucomicrobiales bacterium]|nr:hypothetical protein [Verrucomicrobiales bacterium]
MNAVFDTQVVLMEQTAGTRPFVSVIIPIYNEEAYIAKALSAVLKQDYPPDRFEIIIADGLSTDGTRKIIASFQGKHPNIRLIDNPQRIVPTGLNQAIACARGEIIVRLDGHCEYPNDYVRRVAELRQRMEADNVGGVLVPVGNTYVQKAVAAAYYSRVGFGGYALKGSNEAGKIREVDTVHGGCWKRERLLEVGGFDEEMVRNQDDELSFRLRKRSGRIFQSLDLRVLYHVRSSFKKLFLQFAQYGYWKVQVVRKHPKQASIRHIVPALFVSGLVVLLVGSLFSGVFVRLFALLTTGYLWILSLSSMIQTWRGQRNLWPGLVYALALMHLGYGSGFILGTLRTLFGSLPTDSFFEKTSR